MKDCPAYKDFSGFRSNSTKDREDQQLVNEPGWVVHPDNCHLIGCHCTSREESARLDEQRKKWWQELHTGRNERARAKAKARSREQIQTPIQKQDSWNPLYSEDFEL